MFFHPVSDFDSCLWLNTHCHDKTCVLILSFFAVSPKQETTTPRRFFFRSGGGVEHVHESEGENEPAHCALSRVGRALGLESEHS